MRAALSTALSTRTDQQTWERHVLRSLLPPQDPDALTKNYFAVLNPPFKDSAECFGRTTLRGGEAWVLRRLRRLSASGVLDLGDGEARDKDAQETRARSQSGAICCR